MTRAVVLVVIALAATIARADTPAGNTPAGNTPAGNTPAGNTPAGNTPAGNTNPPAGGTTGTFDEHLARARELHDKGDFAGARDELLAAYRLEPRAELLFALGQVELNLHHYQVAIDYYERFIATSPGAEQVALAQQAIGAARIEAARPPAPTPVTRPPPHREWDVVDTALVAGGGLATLVGGGLVFYSQRLARDHSGTLAAYDHRVDRARTARLAAVGSFAAGAVAVGAALLRWRFRLVETTVEVQPTRGGVAVLLERPL